MSTRAWCRLARALGVPAFLLATSASAHAHLVETGFGAFYDGVAHVLWTPAELLGVIALGMLGGLRGRASARALLFTLPVAWLAGALFGAPLAELDAAAWPWLEGLCVVVTGALVALDARLPRAALLALGAAVLVLSGAASRAPESDPALGAQGLLAAAGEPLALLGSACAILVLVTLCATHAASLRHAWQRIAVRVAGSWIAAIGLLMLAWQARAAG